MGGDPGPTYSYQSMMPRWAEEPHKNIMGLAKDILDKDYQGYGWGLDNVPGTADDTYGQRIAGFHDMQNAAFNARQQMFDEGDPFGDFASSQMGMGSDRLGDLRDVSSTYTPGSYSYKDIVSQYDPTSFEGGTFGSKEASQYMNPYQQAVTNQQLRAATDAYRGQGNLTEAERVGSGSRGSYRASLDDVAREGEYLSQMSDIQERGSASAYGSAQEQFERDRTARLRAGEMTDASVRAANDYFMKAESRNRDNMFRAEQAGDEAAFRAAKMQFEADNANRDALFKEVSGRASMAGLGSRLGTESQMRRSELIKEMQRAGATQREMEQANMDMLYEDWMRQETYDQDQINWMLGLIAGSPQATQTYTQRPGPSAASELLGYGLGAGSLAGMLGYGQGGGQGGGKD